jgi:hypothetical protein
LAALIRQLLPRPLLLLLPYLAGPKRAALHPCGPLTPRHQVGQVLLNLPNSTAKLSLAGGMLAQIGCAAAAVYTLLLLVALYHEHKRDEVGAGAGLGALA